MASPDNPNTFTDNPLDRASHLRANPDWLAAAHRDPDSLFLPLWQLKPCILPPLKAGGSSAVRWLRAADLGDFDLGESVFLGRDGERACFAVDISALEDPGLSPALRDAGNFIDLMAVIAQLEPRDASLLAQAKSMVDWHQRHGYCARCGTPTLFADAGYRRDCPQCQAQHFPRTDPVVISLVVREDKCLLGRNAMFRGPMFSALAGFLEPGESIEEAVAREVMEEVGIEVNNVRYQFTQPWPFPSSLMIGCIADAVTSEITLDENEIAEARWFSRDELRAALAASAQVDYRELFSDSGKYQPTDVVLPPRSAIAHQLLKTWVDA
ncbi:NAD(+) diphosphatase [Haliea sp. E17]|uniref:NAD(+) diphosphatase n=1 Tax=Haliea sp. E17 TaxID=3401576 RepID=UPI003AAC2945